MTSLQGPRDDWAAWAEPTQLMPPSRPPAHPAPDPRRGPGRVPLSASGPAQRATPGSAPRPATAERRPSAYPAQPHAPRPPAQRSSAPRPPSGPARPSSASGRRPSVANGRPRGQDALPPLRRLATGEPIIAPPAPPAPPRFPGTLGGQPGQPGRLRTFLRRKWPRRVAYGAMVFAVILMILAALGLHRLNDVGGAISTQGSFTTETGYMTGPGRVNVLIMGYGGAGHDGAYLTDSMMVISVVPDSGSTTMISVPRDLWVQVPPDSGNYAKINTAYNDGMQNGFGSDKAGRVAGGEEAASKVSEVLGISVSYWLTIDFSGFRDLVNAVGGVDITVPVAFTAQYPANDDASINASWKTIHFNTGTQHMNGEQAIEYARARYVTSPASEGSDFARSARQQLLIRAILSRARQVGAWGGLNGAADALQKTVYTNLSLLDLMLFAQRMDTSHANHIGLSNQNVLVGAQSPDGQDILQPANGDWGAIQRYVQQNLKP